MSVRRGGWVAAALVLTVVGACTSTAAQRSASAGGSKVCELLAGSPDAGLNRAVGGAVGFAHARLGTTTVVKSALVPDVSSVLNARCALIVAAGYQASPSIFSSASRYPRQPFLIADDWFDFRSAPDLTRPNVAVLSFEADQASFLAGYVAAAVSSNHVVGEYGSVNIPTVDVALNGFLAGARAWGQDYRTHVEILGWNGVTGMFAGNDFDRHAAFVITSRLIQQGAHVIFGATGAAILGSAAAAAPHPAVYLVGMYSDAYTMAPRYASKWLTSVVFDMRSPVLAAVRQAAGGGKPGGNSGSLYVGTIANGGVQLGPFHRLGHLVPATIHNRLRALRTGLTQGWVSTDPADYVPFEQDMGGGD